MTTTTKKRKPATPSKHPTPNLLFRLGVLNTIALAVWTPMLHWGTRVPDWLLPVLSALSLYAEHQWASQFKSYEEKYAGYSQRPNLLALGLLVSFAVLLNSGLSGYLTFTRGQRGLLEGLSRALPWMAVHASVTAVIMLVCYSQVRLANVPKMKVLWLVATSATMSVLFMTPSGSFGHYFKGTQDFLFGFALNEGCIVAASGVLTALCLHFLLLVLPSADRGRILGSLGPLIVPGALLHVATGFVTVVGNLPPPHKNPWLIPLAFQCVLLFLASFRLTLRLVNGQWLSFFVVASSDRRTA